MQFLIKVRKTYFLSLFPSPSLVNMYSKYKKKNCLQKKKNSLNIYLSYRLYNVFAIKIKININIKIKINIKINFKNKF